jgi:hypothetical protein
LGLVYLVQERSLPYLETRDQAEKTKDEKDLDAINAVLEATKKAE